MEEDTWALQDWAGVEEGSHGQAPASGDPSRSPSAQAIHFQAVWCHDCAFGERWSRAGTAWRVEDKAYNGRVVDATPISVCKRPAMSSADEPQTVKRPRRVTPFTLNKGAALRSLSACGFGVNSCA